MQCDSHKPNGKRLLVPLFPLPNVVLFPRAVLPLHIFEDRYKTMTAHALSGQRQIAMALLKPGWEKDYQCKPGIDPVVCVGKILTSEKLADGKYNFLLQGESRARVISEIGGQQMCGLPYRVAELEIFHNDPVPEIDLANKRQQLMAMASAGELASTPFGQQFKKILCSPLSTSDAADLIAFTFLDDVQLKQSLLAETDVVRRISRLISALDMAMPMLEAQCRAAQYAANPN
jgi:Lon protease-like protein